MRDRERREDQLRVEAEQIERAPALVGIERAQRFPSFTQHQVLLRLGGGGGIVVAIGRMRDRLLDHPAAGSDRERMQLGANVGVGVRNQPVASFHDMTVGVIEDSAFGVWHRDNLEAVEFARRTITCAFRVQDSRGSVRRTEGLERT